MTANLIIIAVTALMALIGLGGLLFKQAQDQSTGAAVEAGKVDATAVKAVTAIAQAEAAAPTTQAALVDRLKAGSF